MKLVFVISNVPSIGFVIEAYIVKINSLGKFNLNPQRVNMKTISGYPISYTDTDKEVLKLIYNCEEELLAKKFSSKTVKVADFFKTLDEKKFKTLIRPNIEGYLNKALSIISLCQIPLYFINKSHDEINENAIVIQPNDAEVLFDFTKHDLGISYRLRIKLDEKPIKLQNKKILFLTHKPCWVIVNNTLLHFDEEIDSHKLTPFTQKEVVEIPNSAVDLYIHNFILKTFRKFDIMTEGILLNVEEVKPKAILALEAGLNSRPVLSLSFDYKGNILLMSKNQQSITECMVEDGIYTLNKIKRNFAFENLIVEYLYSLGLKSFENVHFFFPPPINQPNLDTTNQLVSAICMNYQQLLSMEIHLRQNEKQLKFFMGQISTRTKILERQDWFDVGIEVLFGQFVIPFVKLRHNIINRIKEYLLPDNTIAIIPDEWFSKFDDLVQLGSADEECFKVNKYHLNILSTLDQQFNEQHQSLLEIKKNNLNEIPVPSNLRATLRSYQYQGFKWMKQMEEVGFSGCLADDMGLGKTIQTIAVLLESHNRQNNHPVSTTGNTQSNAQLTLFNRTSSNKQGDFVQASLIVVPLSLIFNWQQELAKFAPSLFVYTHTGLYRTQSPSVFHLYDIVLTTYGMVRKDIDLLKKYNFNYLILDESQNIRNPQSKAYRAVRSLQSKYRLALTGTPIENSLIDLWAQVNFLNPGLLGGLKQFKKNYVFPIEKQNNGLVRVKLQNVLSPFFMRRTKEEVAPELPTLTEVIHYTEMTDEQRSYYETIKSSVRNSILFSMTNKDRGKLNILILRGLMQLRLASIHPGLLDKSYEFDSGKHEELRGKIYQIIQEGHKVIIFSQFVRHLNLVKQFPELEKQQILMFTGMTHDMERQGIIRRFQEEKECRVLMMTLKAGGVGLNLTAADYILLIDPWWNPAAESQAIARAHRIGQAKKVFAYRFITKDSIEEKILVMQERKRLLAGEFIQNSNPLSTFSDQELIELFK